LNSVAANLRFEKQQQGKAEEEQMIEQLNGLLAGNARLREILVERGIIPPSDAFPAWEEVVPKQSKYGEEVRAEQRPAPWVLTALTHSSNRCKMATCRRTSSTSA
jgi:hypothetical protein